MFPLKSGDLRSSLNLSPDHHRELALLKYPLFTMGPKLKEDIDNGSDNVL